MTAWLSVDMMNPLTNSMLTASCDKANFGWPCDAEVERLRDAYARETDAAKQKGVAADAQKRAYEIGMYYPTGQYTSPIAARSNITGILDGPAPVFWNIEKK
jgi:peptide/nickel transport system substrate-binding protein